MLSMPRLSGTSNTLSRVCPVEYPVAAHAPVWFFQYPGVQPSKPEGVSHASPKPSPSLSVWLALETSGQLSVFSQTPSPSESPPSSKQGSEGFGSPESWASMLGPVTLETADRSVPDCVLHPTISAATATAAIRARFMRPPDKVFKRLCHWQDKCQAQP